MDSRRSRRPPPPLALGFSVLHLAAAPTPAAAAPPDDAGRAATDARALAVKPVPTVCVWRTTTVGALDELGRVVSTSVFRGVEDEIAAATPAGRRAEVNDHVCYADDAGAPCGEAGDIVIQPSLEMEGPDKGYRLTLAIRRGGRTRKLSLRRRKPRTARRATDEIIESGPSPVQDGRDQPYKDQLRLKAALSHDAARLGRKAASGILGSGALQALVDG